VIKITFVHVESLNQRSPVWCKIRGYRQKRKRETVFLSELRKSGRLLNLTFMTQSKLTIDNYLDSHFIHRSNWLRAAVLGANDGIISISSLAIGVASAGTTRDPILLATVAGLVAGALSMAAGEYVSVSSQTDIEKADIAREKQELEEMPEEEMQILAQIYERRGLRKDTALQVARELTAADALGAHIRDELGINEMSQANPIQAAFASGAAFLAGGVLPLLVTILAPVRYMEYMLYSFTILSLIILGTVSAKTGGSSVGKAVLRIVIWGTIAMGLSGLVGYIFGVRV
jgi:VIT1/CCC1 family predicted Fe2+/Mn2+ transporter